MIDFRVSGYQKKIKIPLWKCLSRTQHGRKHINLLNQIVILNPRIVANLHLRSQEFFSLHCKTQFVFRLNMTLRILRKEYNVNVGYKKLWPSSKNSLRPSSQGGMGEEKERERKGNFPPPLPHSPTPPLPYPGNPRRNQIKAIPLFLIKDSSWVPMFSSSLECRDHREAC